MTHHQSSFTTSTNMTNQEEQRRQRAWVRLTDQLKRAIDEVYIECELECANVSCANSFEKIFRAGIQEMCREVIDILQKGLKDFDDVCCRQIFV